MDKLIKLMTKIQQDTRLSFSLHLQGQLIFGDGIGEKYPLKLKETYGFLSFSSPQTIEFLTLLRILIENEINTLLEETSYAQNLESFILGKAPMTLAIESFKKTLPMGKLFLIESKFLEENKILLQEAYENEIHYLWVLEGRLLFYLEASKDQEIPMSIYGSILENTMEEPLVASLKEEVKFEDLPKAYQRIKNIMLTGKTYFKEQRIFKDQNLLLESYGLSWLKENKEKLKNDYRVPLSVLQKEEKSMIRTYVKNHMALQKTATDLHLHRNTLTYRLDKLEKDFNLDLKNMTHVILLYMMVLFLEED